MVEFAANCCFHTEESHVLTGGSCRYHMHWSNIHWLKRYCNCRDVTFVYGLNLQKLPGPFLLGSGNKATFSLTHSSCIVLKFSWQFQAGNKFIRYLWKLVETIADVIKPNLPVRLLFHLSSLLMNMEANHTLQTTTLPLKRLALSIGPGLPDGCPDWSSGSQPTYFFHCFNHSTSTRNLNAECKDPG